MLFRSDCLLYLYIIKPALQTEMLQGGLFVLGRSFEPHKHGIALHYPGYDLLVPAHPGTKSQETATPFEFFRLRTSCLAATQERASGAPEWLTCIDALFPYCAGSDDDPGLFLQRGVFCWVSGPVVGRKKGNL